MSLPLEGHLVVDVTRMLPGAVLVRHLVDLGARVVKVEDPAGGDPMRHSPPLDSGIGVGFCAFFRGVESVALDLRSEADAARFRRLAARADVLVESFRPGTLERWGAPLAALREANPRLVTCSLSSFGPGEADRVAHDLNLSALSGALSLAGSEDAVPRLQLADTLTGLLALSGILAALLERARSGRGRHLDQPLAAGPLPLLVWAWAEAARGGAVVLDGFLAGRAPCYRVYACADGACLAVAALEPKFWRELLDALGLPEWRDAALDRGPRGEVAARTLADRFASAPRDAWLALAAEKGLPLSAVNDVSAATRDDWYSRHAEATPLPSGGTLATPASPLFPWARARALVPAPALGAHTAAVLAELGAE